MIDQVVRDTQTAALEGVSYLHQHSLTNELVKEACQRAQFNPGEYLRHYKRSIHFDEKQISDIDAVFQTYALYQKIGAEYRAKGHQEGLVKLMEEVAQKVKVPKNSSTEGFMIRVGAMRNRLRRGHLVCAYHFVKAEEMIGLMPRNKRYLEILNDLRDKYHEIEKKWLQKSKSK